MSDGASCWLGPGLASGVGCTLLSVFVFVCAFVVLCCFCCRAPIPLCNRPRRIFWLLCFGLCSAILKFGKRLCGPDYHVNARRGRAQLLTIPFSHFVESARFALRVNSIPYDEHAFLPGAHFIEVGRARKGVYINKTSVMGQQRGRKGTETVPFCIGSDALRSAVCCDSWETVEAAFNQAPDSEWQSWKGELDTTGNLLACVLWTHILRDGQRVYRTENYPRWQRVVAWPFMQVAPFLIRRALGLDQPSYDHALDAARKLFDRVEHMLQAQKALGHSFLSGPAIGAYDTTFAALSIFLLLPPQHADALATMGFEFPRYEGVVSLWKVTVDEFRARPGGEHALRVYAELRA